MVPERLGKMLKHSESPQINGVQYSGHFIQSLGIVCAVCVACKLSVKLSCLFIEPSHELAMLHVCCFPPLSCPRVRQQLSLGDLSEEVCLRVAISARCRVRYMEVNFTAMGDLRPGEW